MPIGADKKTESEKPDYKPEGQKKQSNEKKSEGIGDIKKMNIKKFRELGYLQEANRQFFHPLGLALEILIDDKTGEESLGGIWDYRNDPEGILFTDCILSQDNAKEKAKYIKTENERFAKSRLELFGFIIQPIGGQE